MPESNENQTSKKRLYTPAGKSLFTPTLDEKKPVEFPSTFLNKNNHSKPVLNVPNCGALERIRSKVASALEGVHVQVDFVIAYLHSVLKECKVKAQKSKIFLWGQLGICR